MELERRSVRVNCRVLLGLKVPVMHGVVVVVVLEAGEQVPETV